MQSKILSVIFFAGFIMAIFGYPNGGPLEACDSLYPEHGAEPQETEPPYDFILGEDQIGPGRVVNYTIIARTPEDAFRGFMIQVRSLITNKRVGKFLVDEDDLIAQTIDCDNVTAVCT
jgi:hypothetical protein